jgi:hypothetical protein
VSDHYAEFISIRRHILQVDAEGERDLIEKMSDHAQGDWVDGLQMSDDTKPLLIFDPYGSESVGPADDGPVWFAGDPFGKGKSWMRELGEKLIALSEVE